MWVVQLVCVGELGFCKLLLKFSCVQREENVNMLKFCCEFIMSVNVMKVCYSMLNLVKSVNYY